MRAYTLYKRYSHERARTVRNAGEPPVGAYAARARRAVRWHGPTHGATRARQAQTRRACRGARASRRRGARARCAESPLPCGLSLSASSLPHAQANKGREDANGGTRAVGEAQQTPKSAGTRKPGAAGAACAGMAEHAHHGSRRYAVDTRRKSTSSTLEKWQKRSSPPSSGVMKPKPRSVHRLTVPFTRAPGGGAAGGIIPSIMLDCEWCSPLVALASGGTILRARTQQERRW